MCLGLLGKVVWGAGTASLPESISSAASSGEGVTSSFPEVFPVGSVN